VQATVLDSSVSETQHWAPVLVDQLPRVITEQEKRLKKKGVTSAQASDLMGLKGAPPTLGASDCEAIMEINAQPTVMRRVLSQT
jgi:hypothetical protein